MARWWSSVLVLACCQSEPKPPPPPPAPVPVVVSDAAAPLVDLLHVAGAKVAVSSTVANPKYPPKDLVDGNLATAWNSRTGDQIGSWIEVRVPAAAHVAKIQLTVGFTATGPEGDYFTMNPRIAAVHVTRLDTHANLGTHVLDPGNRGLQEIDLDSAGGDFEVQIIKVVPGTRPSWREICVSELAVLGTPPPGSALHPEPPDVVIGSLEAELPPPPPAALPPCETVDTLQLDHQTLELITCTTDQWEAHPGWRESLRRTTLVAKPGGVVADLGDSSEGWEWGASWHFDGWLVAPNGTRAVIAAIESHEVQMSSAHVLAFVVGSAPWQQLTIAEGSTVDVAIDADHRRAEITTHDVDALSGSDGVTTSTARFDGTTITP